MKKQTTKYFLFALLLTVFFIQNTFSQTEDLFFSEYIEGSGDNKAIEIFNGTGEDINLSNYQVWKIGNGGEWTENTPLDLSGTLLNNDVYVICNNSSDANILAQKDLEWGQANFNGDDAVGLAKLINGTWILIDVIGEDGDAPGTGWDIAGITNATKDHTLVRKSTIAVGNTNWSASAGSNSDDSEWIILDKDDFTNLGSHEFTGENYTPPLFQENFPTTNTPSGWEQKQGLLTGENTIFSHETYSIWGYNTFANNGSEDIAAKIDYYLEGDNGVKDWLITPSLDLGEVSVPYQMEFDLAFTREGTTYQWDLEEDDKFKVIISTDNGTTWSSSNVLRSWDFNNSISNIGEHIIIDLSAYTDSVKIGFYAENSVTNNYFANLFFDNLVVKEIPQEYIFVSVPENVDFEKTPIGYSSEYETIEVYNYGGLPLNIASTSISGVDAEDFSLLDLNDYPKFINLNDEPVQISVKASPITLGEKTANFVLTTVEGDEYEVLLTVTADDQVWHPDTTETFDNFPLDYWSLETGQLAENTSFTGVDNFNKWISKDFGNTEGNKGIYLYLDDVDCKAWAMTPPIDISGGVYELGFDIALTPFDNSDATELGENDKIAIIISTDEGATWSSIDFLKEFDNTTTISNTGDHYNINLISYSGYEKIKIGFYGEGTSNNNVYIDNVSINALEAGVSEISINTNELDFGNLQVEETGQVQLEVTNMGAGDLEIYNLILDAPFSCDYSGIILPGATEIIQINFSSLQGESYTSNLTFNSNAENNSQISCTLNATVASSTAVTQDFESDVFPPEGWNISASGNTGVTRETTTVYEGEASAKIMGLNWLFSPELLVYNGDVVSFYYKGEYTEFSPTTIDLKFATSDQNQTDVNSYETVLLEGIVVSNEWQEVTYTFNNDNFDGGKTIYIGIHRATDGAGGTISGLYIDNIVHPAIALDNNPPVAINDSYEVNAGSTLTITQQEGILSNDTDTENDNLTAFLVEGIDNLNLNADGSFTYTPSQDVTGEVNFVYKANDGTNDSGNGIVTITIIESEDTEDCC